MAATKSPATPRLMAFARSIGGAVRGFGRKMLAKVRRVEVAEAAATASAAEVLEMVYRIHQAMVESGMIARDGAPEELGPADIQALPRRNRLMEALEEYKSFDPDAHAEDAEYHAALARFMGAFMMYLRLNVRSTGLGMASLWRSTFHPFENFFQNRICDFGRIAS